MGLKNCKRCGNVFSAVANNKICATCREEEEKDFKMVRDYIYENLNPTISETSQETGVSVRKIKKFIREGRLVEMGLENFSVKCKRCEASIQQGEYCKSCRNELSQGLKSEQKPEKKKSDSKSKGKNKMHVDRRKRRKKD